MVLAIGGGRAGRDDVFGIEKLGYVSGYYDAPMDSVNKIINDAVGRTGSTITEGFKTNYDIVGTYNTYKKTAIDNGLRFTNSVDKAANDIASIPQRGEKYATDITYKIGSQAGGAFGDLFKNVSNDIQGGAREWGKNALIIGAIGLLAIMMLRPSSLGASAGGSYKGAVVGARSHYKR